ncbi:uncharacterized protein HRG_11987 [Hirsutella rhossiliensis]|uniref:Uncharacterized protein n=1 Tax=Hirsutella rhossiliensis TaxID=111463 RepID=A0A9P8MMY6_9HYPO|nr:uncharacterized protein HRG_11987 [Hirsutella rhossiliensis]KAH0956951.1 hypothetical protein HRG_11987 [Hirsutella rhossiliensis]
MLLPLLLLGLTSSVANADIVVSVSDVKPLPLKTASTASTALQLFQQSCPERSTRRLGPQAKVIVSSYADSPHDLAIAAASSMPPRPTAWCEILAQLNLYMTKHAEELRHLFVNFQGQEEIVTHWLENWITPGFSTSNANDNTTATVLMMGLMQQDDWAALLDKLENLRLFGAEPSQYAKNLRPILNMFVKTWDEPQSKQVQAFWKQIVRADKVFTCGTGPIEYDISGWITGFMHWSSNGDVRVPAGVPAAEGDTTLDGITYYRANLNQLPVGYAKAPLKLLDYPTPGTSSMAYVLAGNIGIARAEVASKAGSRSRGGVLAQPLSAWFLYGPVDVNATQTQSDVGSRARSTESTRAPDKLPQGGY